MPSAQPNRAQLLRSQIEKQLENRIPSALTPAPRLIREMIPTGIGPVDDMLGGGLPLGAITQLIGNPSSGRTTFAMSVLANVSRSGHVCAWIDACDEFDPVSAASAGIALPQLLLVRCGVPAKRTPDPHQAMPQQSSCRIPVHAEKPAAGGGSPHPRSEVHGLGHAVDELFKLKLSNGSAKPGTPSANNIRFGKVLRSEQPNSDRLPSRRAGLSSTPAITPIPQPLPTRIISAKHTDSFEPARAGMEQALKAIDILLQNGGFRAIVMDFASFSPERVGMVPLATWFRFRALAESTNTSLLLLTQYPCAKSSAEVSLQLETQQVVDDQQVVTGMAYRTFILKQAFINQKQAAMPARKPPQAVQWNSRCSWVAG